MYPLYKVLATGTGKWDNILLFSTNFYVNKLKTNV